MDLYGYECYDSLRNKLEYMVMINMDYDRV